LRRYECLITSEKREKNHSCVSSPILRYKRIVIVHLVDISFNFFIMATITRHDESLVERDEVLYPNADLIDAEPYYDNFTAIQNALREQTNLVSYDS
jgi:hypothetical protein